MFLSETHLDIFPAEGLRRRLKMDFKVVSPSNGRSGGIILFWKKEVKTDLLHCDPNYIDVRVEKNSEKIWRLTGMYGEPRWEDKYKTWDRMRELKQRSNLPWVMIGDFNEILYTHEKEGGNPRPQNYMQAFRDALSDCDFEDMGFSGDNFTWRRGRIRERLDRALVNGDWVQMHPNAVLRYLDWTRSDHRPILLDTGYQTIPHVAGGGRPRFEAKWQKEEGF
jgi:hypothetical protein